MQLAPQPDFSVLTPPPPRSPRREHTFHLRKAFQFLVHHLAQLSQLPEGRVSIIPTVSWRRAAHEVQACKPQSLGSVNPKPLPLPQAAAFGNTIHWQEQQERPLLWEKVAAPSRLPWTLIKHLREGILN